MNDLDEDRSARTDVIRRVFDKGGHNMLEIRECPWESGKVQLHTRSFDNSEGYYGKIDLILSVQMAHEIGLALIAASRNIADNQQS